MMLETRQTTRGESRVQNATKVRAGHAMKKTGQQCVRNSGGLAAQGGSGGNGAYLFAGSPLVMVCSERWHTHAVQSCALFKIDIINFRKKNNFFIYFSVFCYFLVILTVRFEMAWCHCQIIP